MRLALVVLALVALLGGARGDAAPPTIEVAEYDEGTGGLRIHWTLPEEAEAGTVAISVGPAASIFFDLTEVGPYEMLIPPESEDRDELEFYVSGGNLTPDSTVTVTVAYEGVVNGPASAFTIICFNSVSLCPRPTSLRNGTAATATLGGADEVPVASIATASGFILTLAHDASSGDSTLRVLAENSLLVQFTKTFAATQASGMAMVLSGTVLVVTFSTADVCTYSFSTLTGAIGAMASSCATITGGTFAWDPATRVGRPIASNGNRVYMGIANSFNVSLFTVGLGGSFGSETVLDTAPCSVVGDAAVVSDGPSFLAIAANGGILVAGAAVYDADTWLASFYLDAISGDTLSCSVRTDALASVGSGAPNVFAVVDDLIFVGAPGATPPTLSAFGIGNLARYYQVETTGPFSAVATFGGRLYLLPTNESVAPDRVSERAATYLMSPMDAVSPFAVPSLSLTSLRAPVSPGGRIHAFDWIGVGEMGVVAFSVDLATEAPTLTSATVNCPDATVDLAFVLPENPYFRSVTVFIGESASATLPINASGSFIFSLPMNSDRWYGEDVLGFGEMGNGELAFVIGYRDALGNALGASGTVIVDVPPLHLCDACPAGTFFVDGVTCSPCEGGTFNAEINATECAPCTQGSFAEPGSEECTLCAPGSFANVTGLGSCFPCVEPWATPSEGAHMCNECTGTWINSTTCVYDDEEPPEDDEEEPPEDDEGETPETTPEAHTTGLGGVAIALITVSATVVALVAVIAALVATRGHP